MITPFITARGAHLVGGFGWNVGFSKPVMIFLSIFLGWCKKGWHKKVIGRISAYTVGKSWKNWVRYPRCFRLDGYKRYEYSSGDRGWKGHGLNQTGCWIVCLGRDFSYGSFERKNIEMSGVPRHLVVGGILFFFVHQILHVCFLEQRSMLASLSPIGWTFLWGEFSRIFTPEMTSPAMKVWKKSGWKKTLKRGIPPLKCRIWTYQSLKCH